MTNSLTDSTNRDEPALMVGSLSIPYFHGLAVGIRAVASRGHPLEFELGIGVVLPDGLVLGLAMGPMMEQVLPPAALS